MNILIEDMLTIETAQRELYRVTKTRPNKSTIIRWITRGVCGVQLEGVRLGSQLLTSKEALSRFIELRSAKTIKQAGDE